MKGIDDLSLTALMQQIDKKTEQMNEGRFG